jgi:hypothetical protein
MITKIAAQVPPGGDCAALKIPVMRTGKTDQPGAFVRRAQSLPANRPARQNTA